MSAEQTTGDPSTQSNNFDDEIRDKVTSREVQDLGASREIYPLRDSLELYPEVDTETSIKYDFSSLLDLVEKLKEAGLISSNQNLHLFIPNIGLTDFDHFVTKNLKSPNGKNPKNLSLPQEIEGYLREIVENVDGEKFFRRNSFQMFIKQYGNYFQICIQPYRVGRLPFRKLEGRLPFPPVIISNHQGLPQELEDVSSPQERAELKDHLEAQGTSVVVYDEEENPQLQEEQAPTLETLAEELKPPALPMREVELEQNYDPNALLKERSLDVFENFRTAAEEQFQLREPESSYVAYVHFVQMHQATKANAALALKRFWRIKFVRGRKTGPLTGDSRVIDFMGMANDLEGSVIVHIHTQTVENFDRYISRYFQNTIETDPRSKEYLLRMAPGPDLGLGRKIHGVFIDLFATLVEENGLTAQSVREAVARFGEIIEGIRKVKNEQVYNEAIATLQNALIPRVLKLARSVKMENALLSDQQHEKLKAVTTKLANTAAPLLEKAALLADPDTISVLESINIKLKHPVALFSDQPTSVLEGGLPANPTKIYEYLNLDRIPTPELTGQLIASIPQGQVDGLNKGQVSRLLQQTRSKGQQKQARRALATLTQEIQLTARTQEIDEIGQYQLELWKLVRGEGGLLGNVGRAAGDVKNHLRANMLQLCEEVRKYLEYYLLDEENGSSLVSEAGYTTNLLADLEARAKPKNPKKLAFNAKKRPPKVEDWHKNLAKTTTSTHQAFVDRGQQGQRNRGSRQEGRGQGRQRGQRDRVTQVGEFEPVSTGEDGPTTDDIAQIVAHLEQLSPTNPDDQE